LRTPHVAPRESPGFGASFRSSADFAAYLARYAATASLRDAVLPEPDLSDDRLGAKPEPTGRPIGTIDPHTPRCGACRSAQISRIEPVGDMSKRRPRPVKAQDGMKVHDAPTLELGDLGK